MRARSTVNTMPPEGGHEDLRKQLYDRLQRLAFPAFAECVCHTLEACGYTGVETRRVDRKGKNAGGGWDLEAILNAGLSSCRTLVQLKHSPGQKPVQCRCVDELRGAALRSGAGEAVLVTTGGFSPLAVKAATGCSYPPVRLIDGARLAELMRRHHVGLRRATAAPDDHDRWVTDTAFFDSLERDATSASPAKLAPEVTVTITVQAGRSALSLPQ